MKILVYISLLFLAGSGFSQPIPAGKLPFTYKGGFSYNMDTGYKAKGTGAVQRSYNSKLNDYVTVEDFRADADANDLPAFNRAIAYMRSRSNTGGVIHLTTGKTYTVNGPIVMYRAIVIQGSKSKIFSTDTTRPIISFTGDAIGGADTASSSYQMAMTYYASAGKQVSADTIAYGYGMEIHDLDLAYVTQKKKTPGTVGAIRLSEKNQVNWYTVIKNINITNCDIGIELPDTVGAISFFLNIERVTVNNPQSWGIDFKGDRNSAGTNVVVKDFWVIGTPTYSKAAKGIFARAVGGINLHNVHFELLSDVCLLLESCTGSASNINEESCFYGSYGGPVYINSFVNTTYSIESLNTGNNQHVPQNGNIYLLNIDDQFYSQNVFVKNLQDGNVLVSDTTAVSGYNYFVGRAVGQGAHGRVDFYGKGNSTYVPQVQGNMSIGDANSFIDRWNLDVSGWQTMTFGPNKLLPKGKGDSLYAVTITQPNDSTYSFTQGGASHPIIVGRGSGSSAWSGITGKPTTLSGYGITDAVGATGTQTVAGNKTFSGTTSFTGVVTSSNDVEITDFTKGIIIRSPNGTRWRVTISNTGVFIQTPL